jgi:hypothetical protein
MKNYGSILQSTSTPQICSVAEPNLEGKTRSGWWMAGPNRMERPFPDILFPTMPENPSSGGGDGPHGDSGVSEEARGGTNDFLLPEMVRAQEGALVGRAVPDGSEGQ